MPPVTVRDSACISRLRPPEETEGKFEVAAVAAATAPESMPYKSEAGVTMLVRAEGIVKRENRLVAYEAADCAGGGD